MTSKPWLATYRKHGIAADVPPSPHRSVVDLLEEAMSRFGDRTAFHSFGQSLSYAELDERSGAFAAWLQTRLGINKGDRVAVMLPNLLAFPIAFLGIIRAGAVQVNVNPLYTPRELEHQLNDSGSEVIVVFNGSTPTLAEAIAQTRIRTVITVSPGDGSAAVLPGPAVDSRIAGHSVAFADVLREGAAMPRRRVDLEGDDPLFLQYTGGTTGVSKGACLEHRNLLANITQFKALMPESLREGSEVIVTAIPLYHIFALMVNFITFFTVGAENWLVANPRDVDGFVDVLKKARPSVFMGVNTLYAGLVQHPRIGEVDWSRLRLSGGGGSAVVAAASERWQAITGRFIRQGYGMSETGPMLCFNPAGTDGFNGTTGLPLPGTDVKLLNDVNVEVAIGEPGEICVKGPQVMRGYWNQPEANAEAFTDDGYFRTGDIGVFDDEGFLRIVDRKKDMILVSGFNVFPNEIEAVASRCLGVVECACIGVPDEKTGEAAKLFVVAAPDAGLTAEDLIAFCRKHLTAYKVPRHVQFTSTLPKSTVGKILRRELRHVV